MRLRLFPSTFAGRAVPSEVTSLRTIPLRPFAAAAPTPTATRSLRFLSPRVFCVFNFALRRRRLAGHSCPLSFRFTCRARVWPLSQPGRDPSIPATLLGFSKHPSQCCSGSRVSAPFGVSNPPAVSPLTRREFLRRGIRLFDGSKVLAAAPGFGLENQPCRATCRPRYSFCA